MRKRLLSFTLIELLVVIAIVVLLAAMLVPTLARAREESRRSNCKSNCSQVGKAIFTYTQNNQQFYPFAWDAANLTKPTGVNYAPPYEVQAGVSIACLYPEYLETAHLFKCPSMDDESAFQVCIPKRSDSDLPVTVLNADGLPDTDSGVPSSPLGDGDSDGIDPGELYLWSNRNYVLTGTSYGYDARLYPSAPSNHAIFGDMDGSYAFDRVNSRQNHSGGMNILFVDGHVSWEQGNYASNEQTDNIYAEDPWSADTDSYLVQCTRRLGPSYDSFKNLQRN